VQSAELAIQWTGLVQDMQADKGVFMKQATGDRKGNGNGKKVIMRP
jgi:hypothetical protein